MNIDTWAVVFATVAGPILAVQAQRFIDRGAQRIRIRVDTLKRFYGNRFDVTGDEFTRALNEILVVFNRSPAVMSALRAYHVAVTAKIDSENALVSLVKAMCADLSIDLTDFNDSFFLAPFNTRTSKSPVAALK
ncbi:MAG TPA: DUF6680 family protein [Steroidobacteraceae bacterium]